MSDNGKNKPKRENPTAAAAGQSAPKPAPINYRFVEGYLDEVDRKWLEDNMDSAADCVLELVSQISEGYKLSVSYDRKSERFLASLACSDNGSADFGKILTSRGASPLAATFALWYRHYRKFQFGWGETQRNNSLFD